MPAPLALRLYLPEARASGAGRRARTKVPAALTFQPKGEIAMATLDRVQTAGVRVGIVLPDARYGARIPPGLTAHGLTSAVATLATPEVYPADVTLTPPAPRPAGALGRTPKHPVPPGASVQAKAMIDRLGSRAFRHTTWRRARTGHSAWRSRQCARGWPGACSR